MPRKQNVYEEVARLLDIPGGEQIVKEGYPRMRKFNYWNISIVQQECSVSAAAAHPVRPRLHLLRTSSDLISTIEAATLYPRHQSPES
jgi:hypothetical protein